MVAIPLMKLNPKSPVTVEENSCVPMCLNVFFETELFKTNQDFIDSFEYRKYKNSLGIKDEESEHLGFESVSAKTVVDEKLVLNLTIFVMQNIYNVLHLLSFLILNNFNFF